MRRVGSILHARSLTVAVKAKRTPLIIERDYSNGEEYSCCFCEQRFLNDTPKWKKTWEHLDNDETNEELWNLMWAHWYCNEKKKTFIDYQIMAIDFIKKNQEWQNTFNTEEFLRERKIKQPREEHTEIELNTAHFQKTVEFLAEKITDDEPRHLLKDAIYCITARCRKDTGHGSPQAVRNYINELCCSEGSYKIEKKSGKNYIMRGNGR